jgi:copper chaperone
MATITIKGMHCQHCVGSTRQALEKIPGISDVKIDLEKGEATYQGDIDIRIVKEAITKIGFEVV